MPGRPINPAYVIPVWAPNANYPAGGEPWANTPTKVAHPGASSVGITPRTGVGAQVINKALSEGYLAQEATRSSLTELTDYSGQIAALNFLSSVSSFAATPVDGVWDPVSLRWLIVAPVAKGLFGSSDNCQTFGYQPLVGLGGSATTFRVALSKASGEAVVLTTASADLYEMSAAGTWTYRAAALPAAVGSVCAIVYNPGLFSTGFYVATTTGSIFRLYRSSNRFTWQNVTLPSMTYPNVTSVAMACHTSNGIFVIACGSATVGVTEILTAPLGDTFASSLLNHGLAATDHSVHWSDSLGVFVLCITGTSSSKTYTSSNGVLWTLLSTLASSGLFRVTSIGSMLVAIANPSGRVTYSLDSGATWLTRGYAPGVNLLRSSGDQLVLGVGTKVLPGLSVGRDNFALI